MLARSRAFFADRSVLEVDCPALSLGANVDTHIDVMEVKVKEGLSGYLHTSPEYGMKQLLSFGIGDIYQLSHVFRKGEIGALHEPEFTMTEWYRCGFSFDQMIDETLSYIQLFLGHQSSVSFTYRQAIQTFAGVDYVHASLEQLIECLKAHAVALSFEKEEWDRDILLNCLMSFVVEPKLPKKMLCIVRDYPASQAALAQTHLRGDETVAERFEVYFDGVELANGYHELTDAAEQRKRFSFSNTERQRLGKETLPVDEHFLSALTRGLPQCCGVAVGFDRLMLLRHQKREIGAVIPTTLHAARF